MTLCTIFAANIGRKMPERCSCDGTLRYVLWSLGENEFHHKSALGGNEFNRESNIGYNESHHESDAG